MFKKFLVLLFVAACSSGSRDKNMSNLPRDPSMPQKILLFVPGYYGSTLIEEKTGTLRWAKASNFLFSQTGLADEIPGTKIGPNNKLVVGDILRNVLVLPKLWDVDSYGKTLNQLEDFSAKNNMRLETVAYDWRDDFNNCLNTIDQKIKSFDLKPNDELFVVSHSMGALLMAYYLRYGNQDVETAKENWAGAKVIKRLALVAPPLHGLMILFRDIEDGTSLGLNRALLSARDYSTFKSTYFFLPPKGEDMGLKENGEHVSMGIHDIDKWEKNQWGPFIFAETSEIKAVHSFVSKYMDRSTKFHALMRAPVMIKPEVKIDLLHMRGLGVKTKELASLENDGDLLSYSFRSEGEVDGDGTVTAKSGASLPFFSEMNFVGLDKQSGHLEVLAEPKSQLIIQDFILGQYKKP